MKDLTIKYSIVKGLDIANAMGCAAKAAGKERSAEKLNGGVWEQTVAYTMENIDYTKYEVDSSKEGIAAIREYLFELMESKIYAEVTIPETGMDRDGKVITLLNAKTNKIKWSSWDNSRRIFAYLGDIAKVLAFDKADILYPEQFKVAARCDILQQLGKTGTPLEHIKRLSGQIEGYLPQLLDADKNEAMQSIGTLVIPGLDKTLEAAGLLTRLDSIITGATAAQKEDIKSLLFSLGTKHFVAA